MKKKADIAIPLIRYWAKYFLLLFFPLGVFNGLHVWFYQEYIKRNIIETYQPSVLTFILYITAVTTLTASFIGVARYIVWAGPVRKIGEAVWKVARGDFSARLTMFRKHGKKDYIETIFDNFNTMVEELSGIEMMRNDFIVDVSHELKTPLAVIQNYAALLQGNIPEEKRREYTQIILETSKKLTVLTGNILKLNKLENQGIMPEAKPYALDEQLRRCVFSFEEIFKQKNITLNADFGETDTYLCCNEDTAEVIWNNLLSNALKFTDPGGSVFISLKKQNGTAIVSVRDSGCGMDEAVLKRVFDKFFQADPSRSVEGNGLGLSLVKKSVELLGGTVTAESEPGRGSTFTVSLKSA
jgi:signal transduction histidine kinase